MLTYQIAIPTYKRHDMISNKTLKVLKSLKIKRNIITLFVANKKEYDNYFNRVSKSLYNKIVIGKKGLKNQRNFIQNYYPEGTNLVQLDDDIDNIVELYNPLGIKNTSSKEYRKKSKLETIKNLDRFIINAFKKCIDNKAFLWGIYPVANSYFMNFNTEIGLKFVVGPFWGCIVRHSNKLKLTIDEKENVQRTLQYFTLDNKVIRFNNISIITKYYKTPGGMQEEKKNRKQEALKSAKYLHKKYPNITKIKLTKKSGVPEIVFTKKKGYRSLV
jgi:hypothetical protein